ncbi:MAG TPA: NAD(P)-dependent oxidoreductase [Dehalococcoidia bacterium]|nr:NAD(P)-dependent oxidoreductase [Dehalococcoidia bacterium]
MQVGWIGTGKIGNPMARSVIRSGHVLTVHDLNEAASANLIELGAAWAESPAAAAAGAEIVISSLPGPLEIEQVLTGSHGILAGARPGTIYVDLSSNLPSHARRLAAVAAEHDITYLDAPVSGGVAGAEAATLAVMVGGSKRAFETCRPVLEAIGRNVFHIGDVGTGCVAKLVNNLIGLGAQHLINEALVAGVKAGVDARTLYEVMNVSSAKAYVQSIPRLLERKFEVAPFTLKLTTKDIGLAVTMGRELGVPMPASAATEQALLAAMATGLGPMAMNASLLYLEALAGVEVHDRPATA